MSLKKIQILNTPLVNTERGETLRDFLVSLLLQLWHDGEGFSSKRPFGDSSWQWDIYKSLIKAGHIEGTLDEYGDIDTVDVLEADKLILKAIEVL